MAKLISGAAPEWLRKATERAIRKAETAPQGYNIPACLLLLSLLSAIRNC